MDQEVSLGLALVYSTLRGATPLIFAALGGLLSERSGTVQIALEGKMLIGALLAAVVSYQTQSSWMGLVAAMAAGSLMSALFAFFVLKLKTDQIVTGAAINILAMGFAPFITKLVFNSSGSTPGLSIDHRFSFEPMVIALIVTALISYFYSQTKWGLLVRFAGEAPDSLAAAGYSLNKVRWFSLIGTGALAGLGGASLSLFLASNYSPNMTAGRGFIALAALIFGRWRPGPTVFACLMFSLIDAIQIRLQGNISLVPVQMIQILPYIVTIIALAGFFGRSQAPKFLGRST